MKSPNKIKKSKGFTLVELLVVIAIISILASIVLLVINPAAIFANARNAQRKNDIVTIQSAMAKFLAESPYNSTSRTLGASGITYAAYSAAVTAGTSPVLIGNYSPYSDSSAAGLTNALTSTGAGGGAYATTPTGKCLNGSTSTTNLTVANGFAILLTGSAAATGNTAAGTTSKVDLNNLVQTGGYLSNVPSDPLGGTNFYYMCIDTAVPAGSTTTNPGKLVIYAPNFETTTTVTSVPYVVI